MAAQHLNTAVRLSLIDQHFVCAACGKHGVEVRPDFGACTIKDKMDST
jgi:hypothetical protein